MAKINEFHEIASGSDRVHGDVECGYKIFTHSGKTVLQLDTYGSSERKIAGKISQSIQLDEVGAAYLAGILKRAFPRLKL